MTANDDPLPQSDKPLDKLVRAQLEAEGAGVDAKAMLDRAQNRLLQEAAAPAKANPRWKRWAVFAPFAVAASLLIAFFLLRPGEEVQASPREMVEKAQNAHSAEVDRCYHVRFELSAEMQKRLHWLPPVREETLWTRGDRFWIEPAFGNTGAWGRDEHNRVWLTPNDVEGMVFPAGELPPLMAEFFAVRSLQFPKLLEAVLKDCDLSFLPNEADTPKNVKRIQALPRRDTASGILKKAVIEVEKETHTVRKLILDRRVRDVDIALVTFTFLETRSQDPGVYRIESYLKPGVRPIDGVDENSRTARRRLLRELGIFRILAKMP